MIRARWLGRAPFADAHALQRALFEHAVDPYLLLLEHPPIYTLGLRGTLDHVLVDPADLGADLVRTDRGGDVTFHGPGQLVGYPILSWPTGPDATPADVRSVEQLVIDVCTDVGLPGVVGCPTIPACGSNLMAPDPRQVCAIGVAAAGAERCTASPHATRRSLLVRQDRARGIPGREGHLAGRRGPRRHGGRRRRPDGGAGGAGVGRRRGRVRQRRGDRPDPAGGVSILERKPQWLRVEADMGPAYRDIKRTMRSLDLVTVCEEAGGPNIFECWNDGTATFMVNGDLCTRACKFRRSTPAGRRVCPTPASPPTWPRRWRRWHWPSVSGDRGGPGRPARRLVAAMAAMVRAIRLEPVRRRSRSDPRLQGRPFGAGGVFQLLDILNDNLETVAVEAVSVRLSASVRPQPGRAWSVPLPVLVATKSGLIVGIRASPRTRSPMTDLRNVGVDILTVGQYLLPTACTTCPSPAGGRPTSSPGWPRPVGRSGSPTSSVAADPGPATTPARWPRPLRTSPHRFFGGPPAAAGPPPGRPPGVAGGTGGSRRGGPTVRGGPVLERTAGTPRLGLSAGGRLAELDHRTDGRLAVCRGSPVDVVAAVAKEVEATEVFVTDDSGLHGTHRDEAVETALASRWRCGLVRVDSPYAVAPW